jgi:hypothetical protein
LETGERANHQYLKHRQEAIKHGSIRNKFLQSAAQAWNRNDSRAAKALSLRGQAENEAMRKAHREAAKALYEERNRQLTADSAGSNADEELYVDLHGLHPEEVYLRLPLPHLAIQCGLIVFVRLSNTWKMFSFRIQRAGHQSFMSSLVQAIIRRMGKTE